MLKGGERFFFNFSGKKGCLSKEESHHLIRVYRKKIGDQIFLINGKGKEFLGKITNIIINPKKELQVEVELLEILREEPPPPFRCLTFIPILKGNKTEFLIEKGTELGITDFVIYESAFTIPKITSSKIIRYQEKIISALKQSGRLYSPSLEVTNNLIQTLKAISKNFSLKFLASPQGELSWKELLEKIKTQPKEILLLSGPEGGLSPEEEKKLLEEGFIKISLSPYVLRAETASFSMMNFFSYLLYSLSSPIFRK